MTARQKREWKRILLEETILRNQWIPDRFKELITPRQVEFLLYEGREAMYGGAAGGGKSVALLMGALQYADVPGYHALILRRTYAQLSKAESIMAVSKEWLSGRKDADGRPVRWNGDTYTWTFPSGATLAFGHMDGDDARFNYQGAVYRYVGYDELTQFREITYTYLFSRQRRDADSRIPLRMRSATNPGGIGHDWVKKRFIDPQTRRAESRFFPAKLDDNPNIDREAYISSLMELDPLTRAQLLAGDWDAVAGGRFRREWFGWYRRDPQQPDFLLTADGERFLLSSRPKFQTCDPSASESNAADYFVLSTWCLSPKAKLLWLGCERRRMEIPEQVETCQASYRRWNPQWVAVEEVLNQRALAQLLRRSTTPAMVVRGVSPLGRDKLARATSGINLAHSGRVLLPEDNPAFPLDDVIGELTRFTGDPDQDAHDDIVDTLSYAAELLPGMEGGGGSWSGPSGYHPKGVGATAPLGGGSKPGGPGGGMRGIGR